MYILKDASGDIVACADFTFDPFCEWTDRDVVRGEGGRFYFADEYTPSNSTIEWAAQIRAERNRRLKASDFAMLPDSPLDENARTAFAEYRQALRDISEVDGFPWGGWSVDADAEAMALVPWPVEPKVSRKA